MNSVAFLHNSLFPSSFTHRRNLRICSLTPRRARAPSQAGIAQQKRRNHAVTMVVVPSNMLALGTKAPDFSLLEPLTGKTVSFPDVKLKNGTLVMFLCSRCPFVVLLQEEIKKLGAELKEQDIGMVGISSNDVVNYPHDDEEPMKVTAVEKFPTFPYLIDKTQDVAKSFMAACTPDIFLFDKDDKLVYRGQFDHARPGNGVPVTGVSIREAISLLLEGKQMHEDEMWPSIGCHIKWIKGNEPDYFG